MRSLVLATALTASACTCGGPGGRLNRVIEGVEATPQVLDFGEIVVGTEATKTVTLTNQGKATVHLQPELLSAEFSTAGEAIALGGGASVTVSVTFHPVAAGAFEGALDFTSDGSSLRVDLVGRAKGGGTICIPKTCAELGRQCGAVDDGCNVQLDCGGCGTGVCDPEVGQCVACMPKSCAQLNRTCGSVDDGCGTPLDCGGCAGSLQCDALVGACLCPGGGIESCNNGRDDDCDGAADCADGDCAGAAACAVATCTAGTETRLTQQGARMFGGADIAWNGTELGVAWMVSSNATSTAALDFQFARVDASGNAVASPNDVTTSGLMAHQPRLAPSGTQWAIASSTISSDRTMNLVEVRMVSSAGMAAGPAFVLGSGWPGAIAERPGSTELGVLSGLGHQPTFTRISQGARLGTDVVIPATQTWIDYGDAVWAGSGWGAAWTQTVNNEPGAYFVRLSATGAVQGATKKLSVNSYAGNPRIAWSGSQYGIVWVEVVSTVGAVQFARFDANGQQVGTTQTVTPAGGGAPDIVWAGTAYALVWEDGRTTKPSIWLSLLDELGRKVGNDRQVSCTTLGSHRPAVAFAGSKIAVAWHDMRNGMNPDIYVKLVAP